MKMEVVMVVLLLSAGVPLQVHKYIIYIYLHSTYVHTHIYISTYIYISIHICVFKLISTYIYSYKCTDRVVQGVTTPSVNLHEITGSGAGQGGRYNDNSSLGNAYVREFC